MLSCLLLVVVFRKLDFHDRVQLPDGSQVTGRIVECVGEEGSVRKVVIRDRQGAVEQFLFELGEGRQPGIEYGLFSVFRGIRPVFYFLAMGGFLVTVLATSLRWWLLLRAQGIRVSFPRALQLTWIGLFFNNVLLGAVGGDVVKAFYVSRETDKGVEVVTSVVIDRGVGLAVLVALASAALFLRREEPDCRILFWVSCGVLALFGAAWFVFSNKALGRRLGPAGAGRTGRLGTIFGRMAGSARVVASSRGLLAWVVLLSLVNHLAVITSVFMLSRALAVEVRFADFLAFVPVINFVSALPISVAGWGVSEFGYVRLFGGVGVPAEAAAALSVLFRVSAGILLSLPGLLFLQQVTGRRTAEAHPGDLSRDDGRRNAERPHLEGPQEAPEGEAGIPARVEGFASGLPLRRDRAR